MYFAGDHLPKIHKTGELADSTVACWDGGLHCRPLKSKVFMSFMLDTIVLLRLSSELAMKMEERERLSLRSSMIKVSFFFRMIS